MLELKEPFTSRIITQKPGGPAGILSEGGEPGQDCGELRRASPTATAANAHLQWLQGGPDSLGFILFPKNLSAFRV